jgi:KilA-N domain
MATTDFNVLLTISQSDRPQHVPTDYVRVDHWGSKFNDVRFDNYERLDETKRYWKAVRERLSSHVRNAQKPVFKPGQKYKGTGTWVHPLIAAHYAAWLNPEFAVLVNETFLRVLEGDSDLAADMMIRDHNKSRQQKALKRVKVTLSNKRLNALSEKHGTPYYKVYDDRNLGLYGLNTRQLREVGEVDPKETPQNYLSEEDLSYADAANAMVITADNPTLMAMAAKGIADLHKKITGQNLEPTWDAERLTPSKARAIVHSEQ